MRMHRPRICMTLLAFLVVWAPPAVSQSAPQIDSVFPAATTAATRYVPITIAVSGSNFAKDAVVLWRTTVQLETRFVNSTQLTAMVTPNLVATATDADIVVSNPFVNIPSLTGLPAATSCPGICSNSVIFRVNPPPSIVTALPDGVIGTAYRTQLASTGGTA